ncbi:MAG TPA: hypothetical protein VF532_25065 [Candidatus Angelobacter sp.]
MDLWLMANCQVLIAGSRNLIEAAIVGAILAVLAFRAGEAVYLHAWRRLRARQEARAFALARRAREARIAGVMAQAREVFPLGPFVEQVEACGELRQIAMRTTTALVAQDPRRNLQWATACYVTDERGNTYEVADA